MAYQCRIRGGECDGCGECEELPVMEDEYDVPIYEDDEYYDFDGEIIAKENLEKWAENFLRVC